jgi:putative flippase GtrA
VGAGLTRQLVAYVAIGALATGLDVALFWAFVHVHAAVAVAVTLAFFMATAVQFFLNRHLAFAAFDRPAASQARTYVLVVVASWLVALGVVEAGVRLFGFAPLVSKAISIPPSALVGFLGSRYLAFGPGVRAALRAMRERRR